VLLSREISEKGVGTFISWRKSFLASIVKEAKLQLCFVLELNAVQKPLPADISPSALLELWFDPIVDPAPIFDCPLRREAIKNELL